MGDTHLMVKVVCRAHQGAKVTTIAANINLVQWGQGWTFIAEANQFFCQAVDHKQPEHIFAIETTAPASVGRPGLIKKVQNKLFAPKPRIVEFDEEY